MPETHKILEALVRKARERSHDELSPEDLEALLQVAIKEAADQIHQPHHNYAVANVMAGNCTCKEEGTCKWCVIYYADDGLLGGIILNRLQQGDDGIRIQDLAARLVEWTDKALPNVSWWGKLLHLYEDEIHEIIETPDDPIEWADCLGLIIDGARLAGISIDALLNALDEKIEILGTRTYPPIGPEGWVKHNKTALAEEEH